MTGYRVSTGRPQYEMRGGTMTGTERDNAEVYETWFNAAADLSERVRNLGETVYGDRDCECGENPVNEEGDLDLGETCDMCLADAHGKAFLADTQLKDGEEITFWYAADDRPEPFLVRLELVA